MRVVVDKRFTMRTERTPRIMSVAEAFGIGLEDREFVVYDNLELDVPESGICAIVGNSGGGKSLLLRDLSAKLKDAGRRVLTFNEVVLEDKALIDLVGKDMIDATQLLATAGLSDAFLYLRRPKELSDGQRFRATLAKLLEQNADVIAIDEFGACLDRPTAKTISYMLHKLAHKKNILIIVATTHLDILPDLSASLTVIKRYRNNVEVKYSE